MMPGVGGLSSSQTEEQERQQLPRGLVCEKGSLSACERDNSVSRNPPLRVPVVSLEQRGHGKLLSWSRKHNGSECSTLLTTAQGGQHSGQRHLKPGKPA